MPPARKEEGYERRRGARGRDAVTGGGSAGKGLLLGERGRACRCIAAQELDSDQCRVQAVNCVRSQPVAMNAVGFFSPCSFVFGE